MTTGTLPRDAQPTHSPWLPRLRHFVVDAVGQVRVLRKAYPGIMVGMIRRLSLR